MHSIWQPKTTIRKPWISFFNTMRLSTPKIKPVLLQLTQQPKEELRTFLSCQLKSSRRGRTSYHCPRKRPCILVSAHAIVILITYKQLARLLLAVKLYIQSLVSVSLIHNIYIEMGNKPYTSIEYSELSKTVSLVGRDQGCAYSAEMLRRNLKEEILLERSDRKSQIDRLSVFSWHVS